GPLLYHIKEVMCYRREQTKGKQIVTLRILWHQILLDIWHNGELFRRASWTNSHPLQESTPQSFSRSSLGADRRFDVNVPLQTEHVSGPHFGASMSRT